MDINIGESMRSIRESLKLTRKQVQNDTGINMTYLGQIERNESSPTIDILLRLAKYYNITVSELIGEVNRYNGKLNELIKKMKFSNKTDIYVLLNVFESLSPIEIKYLVNLLSEIKKAPKE